jgi:phytoene synthase
LEIQKIAMGKEPERKSLQEVLPALRSGDRDRYLTVLMCPARARPALAALAAFNLELAQICEATRVPTLGMIRLQWWREAIEAACAGSPGPTSPILDALAPMLRAHTALAAILREMVDARQSDLERIAALDLTSFREQAVASAGGLIRAWMIVQGVAPAMEAMTQPIAEVACAYAAAGKLRSMRRDARLGKLRLPLELVAQSGLTGDEFIVLVADSPPPAARLAIRRLASSLVDLAEEHLANAEKFRWPAEALPAILTARLARLHLRRLRKYHCDPLDERAMARDPLDAWKLLWTRMTGKV